MNTRRIDDERQGNGKRQNRRRQEIESPGAAQEVDVGNSLRRLREARGLSIRALAEQSGLAVNTLSLIENGRTSPSVSTLQQLASAMKVPIVAFFETGQPATRIVYLKAASRPSAAFGAGLLEDLGAGLQNRKIEPFVVTLESQSGSGPLPIVHTGFEFVYCLDGRLTYTVEDRVYLLEPGDSLLFEAHLPHRWQNIDSVPSRSLLVLCPGDERDHPTERHFTPE
jgi:transcriptional regulator with XRE-family HTH domain